tara:strand:+ start:15221 stop:15583 length:363 start_codon:yes stop_codon:yes gene_type:complete
MTLFYSNVQNKRNSLYSYNPSAVTGSTFNPVAAASAIVSGPTESRFRKNENQNQAQNVNKPNTGIKQSKEYNPLGNTLKTMYDNTTKRHAIIVKRLDKIENFMLLILIIVALIAIKLYEK